MRFVDSRPFADPEAAARKLMEIANAVEPVQDGRIFIELINGPFLYDHKGSPAEYGAGLKLAIDRGLAVEARERDLCEAHASRSGFIRLTSSFADPGNTPSALPDLDVVVQKKIVARFREGGFIVFAHDYIRRLPYVAVIIQTIDAIGGHLLPVPTQDIPSIMVPEG